MSLPSFEELACVLEAQVWAVYQPYTRLFSTNGGWDKRPHFFPDERMARAVHSFLNPSDSKNSIVIAFNVSPSHAIVPDASTVPDLVEPYLAQRQAKTIAQHVPQKTSARKKKI